MSGDAVSAGAVPQTLDAAGIAARIPHAGRMALLARLVSWSADRIECRATGHRDADHPLRLDGVLPAAAAVEYAAQAMALHGSLTAPPGDPPRAGLLASVCGVVLHARRLDDLAGELCVSAERLAGDAGQALYAFALRDGRGAVVAEGRASVILNAAPLP